MPLLAWRLRHYELRHVGAFLILQRYLVVYGRRYFFIFHLLQIDVNHRNDTTPH